MRSSGRKSKPSRADVRIPIEVYARAYELGLEFEHHEFGLYGVLIDLLDEAARCSHPLGTFRHEDWILNVDGVTIVGVHRIRCETCDDTKRVAVTDECPACDGGGCPKCRGTGEVPGMIPCEVCAE